MINNEKITWVRKSFDLSISINNAVNDHKHMTESKKTNETITNKIKRLIKGVLRPIYKTCKVVVRPFAFRIRPYMLAPAQQRLDILQNQLQQQQAQINALINKNNLLQQEPIFIIGAGGHAKVVIELLSESGYCVDYCLGQDGDDDFCLHAPVLKSENALEKMLEEGYKKTFVAIGDNEIREKIGDDLLAKGFTIVNAISPHALVSPSVALGCGIAIMRGAVINANTTIDDFAIINTGASIDHDGNIEKAAHIAPQCGLAGNISVGERSFLGVGCKVIPEIKIGNDVTAGAGSVIISNIPDVVTICGVPAKIKPPCKEAV